MNCVAIVLAAGASRRLGQPKQLVKFRGQSLVRLAVEKSMSAGSDQVIVVTGAHADDVAKELIDFKNCGAVYNEGWQSGMGSSLAVGADAVAALTPAPKVILIQVCDQPLIPVTHLSALVRTSLASQSIAATVYPDATYGVPSALPFSYCDQLTELHGKKGAKSILNDPVIANSIHSFPCSAGLHDIDTVEDLRILDL